MGEVSSETKNGRAVALPQVVNSDGAPGTTRTCDPLIRSQNIGDLTESLSAHASDFTPKLVCCAMAVKGHLAKQP